MPAYAEEAADLQHGETQLLFVLVRDHIIDSPDLLVLVVDDAAANQLAHPIAFRDYRKIHLDELHPGLRQSGAGGKGNREPRERGPDHPARSTRSCRRSEVRWTR